MVVAAINRRLAENFVLLLAASCGLYISCAVTFGRYLHVVLPCTDAGLCEKVLNHPLSEIGGIPVSAAGILAYGIILLACLVRNLLPDVFQPPLDRLLIAITSLGILASALLYCVSLFVIRSTCLWCMGSDIAMAVCFTMAMRIQRSPLTAARTPETALIPCALVVSILGIALVREWNGLRWIAIQYPVAMNVLSRVPNSEVLGLGALGVGPAKSDEAYVGFYRPGCGGCAKSIREVGKLAARRLGITYKLRFMAHDPLVSTYRIAAALEGLGPNGYPIAMEWFSGKHELSDFDEFRALLRQRGIEDDLGPNSRLIKDGVLRLKENEALADRLHYRGAPFVICVSHGQARPVDPITLRDIGS